MINRNVEIITLIYKSVDYLRFIAEQMKSDRCKADGWNVGIRILAIDATPEVLEELKKLDIPYTIHNNFWSNEYYLNKVYRAYNYAVITSEYDNVVLINSDYVIGKNYLTNLLKHHDGVNIPCGRLIESGKMPSGENAINMGQNDFGRSPKNIDKEGFDRWVAENAEDKVLEGGLFMPVVLERKTFIDSCMYPIGNIYHNGIGTADFGGRYIQSGDDFYFKRVLAKRGMKHITVCDSCVYHIIEGEKDE